MEKGKFVVVSLHVLHETLHWEVTRRSRAVDVKDNSNVLKSVMHVQSTCFADKTNCFFLTLSLSSSSLSTALAWTENCLVPRPDYSARLKRFGSRGPSENVRRFPPVRLGYVIQVN